MTLFATLFFFIIAVTIKFVSDKKRLNYSTRTISFGVITAVILLVALTVSSAVILDSKTDYGATSPASIEEMDSIKKFVTSIENGNLFSNRGMIWKYTFRNIKLFGNGPSFYADAPMLTPDQNSAHNSYIAVLGHYGIIAFIAFIVFCVYMLILAVKHCLTTRYLYIYPFIVLVNFYTASITEDLFYMFSPRTAMFMFFAACAYLMIDNSNKTKDVLDK